MCFSALSVWTLAMTIHASGATKNSRSATTPAPNRTRPSLAGTRISGRWRGASFKDGSPIEPPVDRPVSGWVVSGLSADSSSSSSSVSTRRRRRIWKSSSSMLHRTMMKNSTTVIADA
jgi:hypothetical protein